MTRDTWSALPIVLILIGLPADGFTQSLACYPTRRGESATQAARRVTGNGGNAYQAWFQIMDRSSRFVPKSQYNRIKSSWRACIIKPAVLSSSSKANGVEPSEAADDSAGSKRSAVSHTLAAATPLASADDGDLANVMPMLWLCVAMIVPWFGWRAVGDHLSRRKTAAIVAEHFAQRFVDEFERPLLRYDAWERPVKSRVRVGARPGRFDILLAPGEGRRYPNLSDHKKNVEYDVARVMAVLADDTFVSGTPYTRARWIVVPFRFTSDPKQSGVACISSL